MRLLEELEDGHRLREAPRLIADCELEHRDATHRVLLAKGRFVLLAADARIFTGTYSWSMPLCASAMRTRHVALLRQKP